jgi:hypothetical protein
MFTSKGENFGLVEKKKKKKIKENAMVVQSDEDPSQLGDIESLHIRINLKPHNYVLVHFTLN